MNKTLYITEPAFKPYPITASTLAILGKYEKSMLWFFENTTNFFSCIDNGYTDFFSEPFRKNPFLEWQCISRNLIKKYKIDLIPFLIDSINDNYYIFLGLNHFYISVAKAFGSYDYMHDALIYGYDNNSKKFNVADFFPINIHLKKYLTRRLKIPINIPYITISLIYHVKEIYIF